MTDSSDFASSQPLHVRLYGRPGCHLCHDVGEMLATLHDEFDFWVEKINIEDDPIINHKWAEKIPVVTVDGGNRVAGQITKSRLKRAFQKAMETEVLEHAADEAEALSE